MASLAKDRSDILTIQNGYRLKWHKLLIYFGMWLSALTLLGNAGMLLMGSHYGNAEDQTAVYSMFPDLRHLDVFFGVAYLALAVYCVKSRFMLARLQKNGVRGAIFITLVSPVLEILYQGFFCNILGDYASLIGLGVSYESLLYAVVFALILFFYYRKRKDILE